MSTECQTKVSQINLFDLGCLVNLKIRQWSGRKMLTRSDLVRLGYDPEALPAEIVNLGRKLMVPRAEIQALTQIEQRARKVLEKNSVPFAIASAHFVPSKLLPTVEQQIVGLKEEFFKRVDSFISRFDELVNKVKNAHPDFWNICLKDHYPQNPKALRNLFQFDIYMFHITSPASVEQTTSKEICQAKQIQDEKKYELRKKLQKEVGEFVEEYTAGMRQEVVKFCELMTARINGRPYEDEESAKKLTQRTIGSFRKHVDRFRSMNIFGDDEIEKMLVEFKNTFLDNGVSAQDLSSDCVKTSVTKALEAIRTKAAMEGENSDSGFVGELKRKVIL